MYKVISFFTDLHDDNHPYNVGDTFPREGISVSKERLKELAGSDNKQGKPLIEQVDNSEDNEPEPEKPDTGNGETEPEKPETGDDNTEPEKPETGNNKPEPEKPKKPARNNKKASGK